MIYDYIAYRWFALQLWFDLFMWKLEYVRVMKQLVKNIEKPHDTSCMEDLVEKGVGRFYTTANPEDAAYYVQGLW